MQSHDGTAKSLPSMLEYFLTYGALACSIKTVLPCHLQATIQWPAMPKTCEHKSAHSDITNYPVITVEDLGFTQCGGGGKTECHDMALLCIRSVPYKISELSLFNGENGSFERRKTLVDKSGTFDQKRELMSSEHSLSRHDSTSIRWMAPLKPSEDP